METSTKAVVIAAGLGVAAYFAYRSFDQVGKAVGTVGTAVGNVGAAVNPLNPDNVFAGAVNKVGAAVSGNSGFSLGSWIYDLVHPTSTATSSTPAQPIPMDWGTGSGWDVTTAATPSAPLGQIAGPDFW